MNDSIDGKDALQVSSKTKLLRSPHFPIKFDMNSPNKFAKKKKIQHREYTKGSKGNDPWTCWAIWAKIQAHATFAFLLFLFYYREQTLFFKKI